MNFGRLLFRFVYIMSNVANYYFSVIRFLGIIQRPMTTRKMMPMSEREFSEHLKFKQALKLIALQLQVYMKI